MNEKLKFSWGHIIAFLAIIAVGYVTFMGLTYLTDGNFTYALIGTGATMIVYLIVFIGAQWLKGAMHKMNRKIIWERILLLGSPLVFVAGMIFMSHFWTVQSKNDEVVKSFTSSIKNARGLFTDYETYSRKRIDDYSKGLDVIVAQAATNPKRYSDAGFSAGKEKFQKENMVETLRLQLLSQNYDSLQVVANAWIEDASQGASTWNIFLLGNTREIKEALNNWENQLRAFSAKELSNERLASEALLASQSAAEGDDATPAAVAHFTSQGAQTAIAGITSLGKVYTTQDSPTLRAILFGLIIYAMLLFPYFLQDRDNKSPYKNIFAKRKGMSDNGVYFDGPLASGSMEPSMPIGMTASQEQNSLKSKNNQPQGTGSFRL